MIKQGNRAMMKDFALAASMTMLIALPAQALARPATQNAQYLPAATAPSDWPMVRAFNAFDPGMTTRTVAPNAHPYHGGPKSND
jgi:hypothetical protein